MEIKHILNEHEYELVNRLRYDVYIEEMNYKQNHVCHERKFLWDPLDETGVLFGVFENGEAIGTCLTNYAKDSDLGYYPELYNMKKATPYFAFNSSITTKLIVSQKFRHSMVGFKLALASYEKGLHDGIQYNFVDCEPEMVPFFQRLGFTIHEPEVVHPLFGKGIVMVLEVDNEEKLREARSPFLKPFLKWSSKLAPAREEV